MEYIVIIGFVLLLFSPILFGPRDMAPWEIGEDQ